MVNLSEDGYTSFLFLSDFLSFFFLTLLAILPIFIIVFYCIKFKKLNKDKFKERYGTVYEGLLTKRRSTLFFPVFFLIRRYTFAAISFYLNVHPSFFIFILLAMTVIAAAYLLHFRPFKTKLL